MLTNQKHIQKLFHAEADKTKSIFHHKNQISIASLLRHTDSVSYCADAKRT